MDRGYSVFCQLTSARKPTGLWAGGIDGAMRLPGDTSVRTLAAGTADIDLTTSVRAARHRVRAPDPPGFIDRPESAPSPLSAARSAAAAKLPWVVVLKSALRSAQPLECHRAVSSCSEDRVYRIDFLAVSSPGCLEHFHDANAPRVLVIDVALIGLVSAETLRRHRRRMPATDLLLASDPSCPPDRSLVFRSQARGCVDWAMGSEQLAPALDAVLAGELWFSRRMLQALYLASLEAGPKRPTPPEAAAEHDALSARECEVLGCMRHGLTNKQIAERLGISVNTVKKHLAHVYEKHGLHNGRQTLA